MTLLHPGEKFPNLAVTPIDGAAPDVPPLHPPREEPRPAPARDDAVRDRDRRLDRERRAAVNRTSAERLAHGPLVGRERLRC